MTESWAGPGNKAMNSVASTIVRLQYPGAHESPRQSSKFSFAETKSHVMISLNSHREKLSSLIKTSTLIFLSPQKQFSPLQTTFLEKKPGKSEPSQLNY